LPKLSRVFRRFLISYIIILIIPSLAGFLSYHTSIAVTQSLSIDNIVTQLQNSQEIMERRIAEVQGFTIQMALNQDLNFLINESAKDGKPNIYGIWNMTKELAAFNKTNFFLNDFYIYLKNYNVIITPGSAYIRPNNYYESSHYQNLSFDQWKQTILGKVHSAEIMPLSPFVNDGTQTSVVTYLQSLPLEAINSSPPAVIAVVIDKKTISDLMSGLEERYGGWSHISDAQGHTIFIQGTSEAEAANMAGDPRFDQHKVSQFYDNNLVITIRSKTNGWVYSAGIPQNVLMENANKIKQITWLFTGSALLLGLLVGFLLSYRNSAPIIRLVGVMKEQFGKDDAIGRNEYDFLYGNISDIITNNKRLETELNRQLPLVRDAFLKRLIAGEFQSREETAAAAAQAGIELDLNTGYAGILQINGYSGMDSVEILNELYAARLILKQALLDCERNVLLTDMGSDRIVVIFDSETEKAALEIEREEISSCIDQIARYVFAEYKITTTTALGDAFLSPMEVSHSFEQARQTLEYAVHVNEKGILWFRETRMEGATYYYPLDLELRLISTIRAGDIEEAKPILGLILAQNTETRELSIEMKHQLIGELKGTFLKLLDQKVFLESDIFEDVKNRILGIQTSGPIELIRREINGIMEKLCEWIAVKKNDTHAKIVMQINEYIAEAYGDSQLNLYRIAEKIERPEKYISLLFKEVTGTNLSDHLEKIRVEHAVVLLKGNELTIDEIAVRVGYNSSHSFRRAFKRVTGVSPSLYRQSVAE
jgi:two-component system response regulator YesN